MIGLYSWCSVMEFSSGLSVINSHSVIYHHQKAKRVFAMQNLLWVLGHPDNSNDRTLFMMLSDGVLFGILSNKFLFRILRDNVFLRVLSDNALFWLLSYRVIFNVS